MLRTAKPDATPAQVLSAAVGLLARREHSAQELCGKLISKGYPEELVSRALEQLAGRGSLSDARFAEVFARSPQTKVTAQYASHRNYASAVLTTNKLRPS